jgi:hypothetical protein
VIVVLQDDPPAGPHCPHHRAHHRERVGNVLEDEPGMGEIVRSFLEGGADDVALAQFEQVLLAFVARLAQRFGDLFGAALDPDRANSRFARHRPGELRESAAEVDKPVPGANLDFTQGGVVEKLVQAREAHLLLGRGAVDVARLSQGVFPSSAPPRERWR